MSKSRLVPIALLVALSLLPGLLPTSTVADDDQKPLLRESSVNHRSATRRTLSQITLYTDLWHLAVIRGNDEEAVRYQQTLVTIARSDIDATARLTRRFARSITLAGTDTTIAEQNRKTLALRFTRSLELLKSKLILIRKFDRKRLSDNTSFLAAKYIDVLRRQMGLEKIWLATNIVSLRLRETDH